MTQDLWIEVLGVAALLLIEIVTLWGFYRYVDRKRSHER